jgi:metal-dependent hydrolase (beta-lactamase superfamily II)
LPKQNITVAMNIPVVDINGRTVTFETGIGSSSVFGDGRGLLQDSLVQAGIDSKNIDAVVCSHPHPDHIGGLCDPTGTPRFPNASIYLAENDFHFLQMKYISLRHLILQFG